MATAMVADKTGSDDLEAWRQNQLLYVLAVEILGLALVFLGQSLLLAREKERKLERRHASFNELSEMISLDHKNGMPAAHTFCYDNPKCSPDTWSGQCAIGGQQSPVDIHIPSDFVLGVIQQRRSLKLNKMYKKQVIHHYYAQNNGHTVQFELTPDTEALMSDLRISGGDLGASYKFAQLHFHWGDSNEDGSEHAVNNQKFPMELHVVHYRSKYADLKEAMDAKYDRSAIAVMAVFYHIAPYDNLALRPIVNSVKYLTFPGNVTEFDMDLNIAALYPNQGQDDFGRYYGSLTTPPCDETVIWTVFLNSVPISMEQMSEFRQLRNSEMSDFNYRPLQPLNGREVNFYKPSLLSFLY